MSDVRVSAPSVTVVGAVTVSALDVSGLVEETGVHISGSHGSSLGLWFDAEGGRRLLEAIEEGLQRLAARAVEPPPPGESRS